MDSLQKFRSRVVPKIIKEKHERNIKNARIVQPLTASKCAVVNKYIEKAAIALAYNKLPKLEVWNNNTTTNNNNNTDACYTIRTLADVLVFNYGWFLYRIDFAIWKSMNKLKIMTTEYGNEELLEQEWALAGSLHGTDHFEAHRDDSLIVFALLSHTDSESTDPTPTFRFTQESISKQLPSKLKIVINKYGREKIGTGPAIRIIYHIATGSIKIAMQSIHGSASTHGLTLPPILNSLSADVLESRQSIITQYVEHFIMAVNSVCIEACIRDTVKNSGNQKITIVSLCDQKEERGKSHTKRIRIPKDKIICHGLLPPRNTHQGIRRRIQDIFPKKNNKGKELKNNHSPADTIHDNDIDIINDDHMHTPSNNHTRTEGTISGLFGSIYTMDRPIDFEDTDRTGKRIDLDSLFRSIDLPREWIPAKEEICTGNKITETIKGKEVEVYERRKILTGGIQQRVLSLDNVLEGKEGYILGGTPYLRLIAPLRDHILVCLSPPEETDKIYGIIHSNDLRLYHYSFRTAKLARILMPSITEEARNNAQSRLVIASQEKHWKDADALIEDIADRIDGIVAALQRRCEVSRNITLRILVEVRSILHKAFNTYHVYALFEKYCTSDCGNIKLMARQSMCAAIVGARYALAAAALSDIVKNYAKAAEEKAEQANRHIRRFKSIYNCYQSAMDRAREAVDDLRQGGVEANECLENKKRKREEERKKKAREAAKRRREKKQQEQEAANRMEVEGENNDDNDNVNDDDDDNDNDNDNQHDIDGMVMENIVAERVNKQNEKAVLFMENMEKVNQEQLTKVIENFQTNDVVKSISNSIIKEIRINDIQDQLNHAETCLKLLTQINGVIEKKALLEDIDKPLVQIVNDLYSGAMQSFATLVDDRIKAVFYNINNNTSTNNNNNNNNSRSIPARIVIDIHRSPPDAKIAKARILLRALHDIHMPLLPDVNHKSNRILKYHIRGDKRKELEQRHNARSTIETVLGMVGTVTDYASIIRHSDINFIITDAHPRELYNTYFNAPLQYPIINAETLPPDDPAYFIPAPPSMYPWRQVCTNENVYTNSKKKKKNTAAIEEKKQSGGEGEGDGMVIEIPQSGEGESEGKLVNDDSNVLDNNNNNNIISSGLATTTELRELYERNKADIIKHAKSYEGTKESGQKKQYTKILYDMKPAGDDILGEDQLSREEQWALINDSSLEKLEKQLMDNDKINEKAEQDEKMKREMKISQKINKLYQQHHQELLNGANAYPNTRLIAALLNGVLFCWALNIFIPQRSAFHSNRTTTVPPNLPPSLRAYPFSDMNYVEIDDLSKRYSELEEYNNNNNTRYQIMVDENYRGQPSIEQRCPKIGGYEKLSEEQRNYCCDWKVVDRDWIDKKKQQIQNNPSINNPFVSSSTHQPFLYYWKFSNETHRGVLIRPDYFLTKRITTFSIFKSIRLCYDAATAEEKQSYGILQFYMKPIHQWKSGHNVNIIGWDGPILSTKDATKDNILQWEQMEADQRRSTIINTDGLSSLFCAPPGPISMPSSHSSPLPPLPPGPSPPPSSSSPTLISDDDFISQWSALPHDRRQTILTKMTPKTNPSNSNDNNNNNNGGELISTQQSNVNNDSQPSTLPSLSAGLSAPTGSLPLSSQPRALFPSSVLSPEPAPMASPLSSITLSPVPTTVYTLRTKSRETLSMVPINLVSPDQSPSRKRAGKTNNNNNNNALTSPSRSSTNNNALYGSRWTQVMQSQRTDTSFFGFFQSEVLRWDLDHIPFKDEVVNKIFGERKPKHILAMDKYHNYLSYYPPAVFHYKSIRSVTEPTEDPDERIAADMTTAIHVNRICAGHDQDSWSHLYKLNLGIDDIDNNLSFQVYDNESEEGSDEYDEKKWIPMVDYLDRKWRQYCDTQPICGEKDYDKNQMPLFIPVAMLKDYCSAELGLEYKQVPGFGNCLFHSIAELLNHHWNELDDGVKQKIKTKYEDRRKSDNSISSNNNNNNADDNGWQCDHALVRSMICEGFANFADRHQELVTTAMYDYSSSNSEPIDYKNYLVHSKMEQEFTWGGQIEMWVAEDIFNIIIAVFDYHQRCMVYFPSLDRIDEATFRTRPLFRLFFRRSQPSALVQQHYDALLPNGTSRNSRSVYRTVTYSLR